MIQRASAALFFVAACSSFGTSPTSTSGEGGTSWTTPSDGATGADASLVIDFCRANGAAPGVVFCTDFESGWTTPPFELDNTNNAEGALFEVTAAPDRPSSRALHVRLPEAADTRNVDVSKRLHDIPTNGVRLELELDVRVEAMALEYSALAALAITALDYAAYSGVASYSAGSQIGGLAPEATLQNVPLGTWHHVRVRVDLADNGRWSEVTIDGTGAQRREHPVVPSSARFNLRIGAFFTSKNRGSADVFFDNVIVRTSPL